MDDTPNEDESNGESLLTDEPTQIAPAAFHATPGIEGGDDPLVHVPTAH